MFESVRNSKWLVQVFLLLIALSFALWGIQSYLTDIGREDAVAVVGGTKISAAEFAQARREQQEQLAEALGANYTPDMLNTPEARRSLVSQLVNQRLLTLDARAHNIVVTDAMLAQVIRGIPSLTENGEFSPAKYEAFARSRGYSVAGFEAQLRRDLLIQQALAAVGDSAVPSQAAAAATYKLLSEKRIVSELRLRPQNYRSGIKIDDAAITAYYEANGGKFEQPEQVRAAYVTLTPEVIEKQVAVSDDEIQAWYEGNKRLYAQPEERRASHILIAADRTAAADVRKAAKTKAEKLLSEIRSKPGEFARLARENSEDPGSAGNGGDLGYFARGAMEPAFEEAAFALPDGGLSDVVETEFGYHIIKVTGLNPGREKPLAEVKAQIERELRDQAVQRRFAEAAEQFSNIAYEQSDSLKPLVDQFKLKQVETGWIVRGKPTAAPVLTPKVVAALFGNEAIQEKRNTEAVEVAPRTLVVARVLEHRPAARQELAAVKSDIREILINEAAAKKAEEAGGEQIAALRAGKDANFSKPVAVSRLEHGGLPMLAARAVLDASVAKLPAFVGVSLADGSFAIYKIASVEAAAEAKSEVAGRLESELAGLQAQQELQAYLATLRQRYEVKINAKALDSAV